MKLIIVESPNKKSTIANLLNGYGKEKEFLVEASVGHIQDIKITGKYNLGVDIDSGNFEVIYEVNKDKQKVVNRLTKLASEASEVYLATDPDREGEAISWHLANVLNLDVDHVKRLYFHEITKKGINDAFLDVKTIDMPMVRSQEARRVLDRIIGFRLSWLLQQKINSKSAGRVQSAVLKLICDREKEIIKFNKEEYYNIFVTINKDKQKIKLKLDKEEIKNINDAEKVLNEIGEDVNFVSLEQNFKTTHPFPPFTTSTLQQEAYSKFKYDAKKTMNIAQKLFEGINLKNKGHQGLITYMRTDSIRLSPIFIASAKKYISDNFGEEYVGKAYVQKSKDGVQDAHEAIRPVDLSLTPESLKDILDKDQLNIYELIFDRAVSSIMASKETISQTLTFSKNNHIFKADKQKLTFDGFSKLYSKYEKKKEYGEFPNFSDNEVVKIAKKESEQEFSKPKPRYTSGSIVKLMEDSGIGRPSTYGSTIDTLKTRGYVSLNKGVITPTSQGMLTSDTLDQYFGDLINVSYTANMEKLLDEIQNYPVKDKNDREKEIVVLRQLNGDFEDKFKYALTHMETKSNETGEMCPKCGRPLVYRKSKFGNEFIGCSGFPECNYIKPEETGPEKVCPKCHKGHLVVRKGPYGKFLGCSEYPSCNYMEKIVK